MPWPQAVDYNSAIQDPRRCFADADLAHGQPVAGMMPGIPLSWSGNFATVYKIQCPGGLQAVKCFTRKVENLQLRYKEISDHLKRNKRRFAVDFQYLQEGIKVADTWYPVVKMQWVEGFTLNEFLRERVGNSALLEQMCQLWLRLGNELREVQMAHGDLQHGNVMLVPGNNSSSMLLRLVDYDGMWVPALADRAPGEVGHANYQHPDRLSAGGYSADIDRFAHLAIFTALRCLVVGGKTLWTAHDNEENILFRAADFKTPQHSKLFSRLLTLPDANAVLLAGHLLLASQGPLDRVPLLSDLVSESGVAPLSVEQIIRLRELVPSAPLGRPTATTLATPAQPSAVEAGNPMMNRNSVSLLDRLKSAAPDADRHRLTELYFPLIHSWISRCPGLRARADDLTQGVLVVVVRSLPSFESRNGSFRAWLRQIIANRIRAFRQANEKHRSVEADGEEKFLSLFEDPSSDLARRWDEDYDQHLFRKLLAAVRPDFEPDTWQAFTRFALDGRPAADVARELAMSESAVVQARFRILKRLREEAGELMS